MASVAFLVAFLGVSGQLAAWFGPLVWLQAAKRFYSDIPTSVRSPHVRRIA